MIEQKTTILTRRPGRPRGVKNKNKHQLRQDIKPPVKTGNSSATPLTGGPGGGKERIKNSAKKVEKFVDPVKAAMAKKLLQHPAVVWANCHGMDVRNMVHRALKTSEAKVVNACKKIVATYERNAKYLSGLFQSVRYMFYGEVDGTAATTAGVHDPTLAMLQYNLKRYQGDLSFDGQRMYQRYSEALAAYQSTA